MNQIKNKKSEDILYLGRWVSKDNFRVFVYDIKGNQKLANSYNDYQNLMANGLWFSSKEEAANQKGNKKYVALSDSK